jgi:uncharacterized protein YdhG (YjbR/CyaY superfamily)
MNSAKSVDAYIKAAPKELRRKLHDIRRSITTVAPYAEETMSYGMPAYRYKGRLAYFAYFKQHISLFVMPPVLLTHKKETSGYSTTKSAIHFPLNKKIPVVLIKKLVRAGMRQNEKKKKLPHKIIHRT